MAAPPSWMTQTDQYILHMLDQPDLLITPRAVWLSLRHRYGDDDVPTRDYIAQRLRGDLTTHGLVHQPFLDTERGYYGLTELGRRFLHDADARPEEFVADIDDDTSG